MMDITEYGMLRKSLENYSDDKFDAITTDMDYKGSVASASNLPASGTLGDIYTTVDTGARYVWDGTQWTQIEYPYQQQINKIQEVGTEVLDSIPEDYTELSETVEMSLMLLSWFLHRQIPPTYIQRLHGRMDICRRTVRYILRHRFIIRRNSASARAIHSITTIQITHSGL